MYGEDEQAARRARRQRPAGPPDLRLRFLYDFGECYTDAIGNTRLWGWTDALAGGMLSLCQSAQANRGT